MKHPGIQLVSSREILCLTLRDWGLHKVCPLLMFPALLINLLHSLDLLEFHQHIMFPPTTGPLYMID